MNYKNILIEQRDGIGILIINRPESLNALNNQTILEIEKGIDFLSCDSETGIIILTGAGEKSFVAGADIGTMINMTQAEGKAFVEMGHRVLNLIEDISKPVIAAVNGYALGGGLELALACDMIFASTNAKFGLPEINLGIIPGFGGTQRLPRLVGKIIAKQLIMTGEIFTAEKALNIGLVNDVFNSEGFLDQVIDFARIILSKPPLAVESVKNVINKGINMPFREAGLLEILNFTILMTTGDQKEGMKAFLKKRKPLFRGE
ncbi:MAG: enoyl-CoA hydratase/isomerase family protein [Bacteroidales bacterium]|nr:enoyl-CoA hydratase/isomerase family protein [Bacteroidales bacterium]